MDVVRVIPCLDVKDSRVVKGVGFLDLKDAGDPVELASYYEKEGADELIFLDIGASVEGRSTMVDLLRDTASAVFIPLTVGGGVTSLDQAAVILHSGADKVSFNSAAVRNPKLIGEVAKTFGSQSVVVAIDVKRVGNRFEVFTHGGTQPTGVDALSWAQEVEERGAGELLVTSMDRDGTKEGFDIELVKAMTETTSIPVIASGGVGSIEDFIDRTLGPTATTSAHVSLLAT